MLSFVADEHVPQTVVNALRSNGYDVHRAQDTYGAGTDDKDLLKASTENGRVILTNDRDFARLAREIEHSGVILYNDQELRPRDVVRAIVRIERGHSNSLDNRTVGLKGGSDECLAVVEPPQQSS